MLKLRRSKKRDKIPLLFTARKLKYAGLCDDRSFITQKRLHDIVLDTEKQREGIPKEYPEDRQNEELMCTRDESRKQLRQDIEACCNETTQNSPRRSLDIPKASVFDSKDAFDVMSCSNESATKASSSSGASITSSVPKEPVADLTKYKAFDEHTSTASLILSAERTLFAALNNSWLVALGGVGLMSVGSEDYRATQGGIILLAGGIASALLAYGMHFFRLRQLSRNQPFVHSHSIIWILVIAFLTVVTLALELYFGILYPYLKREKAVTISS